MSNWKIIASQNTTNLCTNPSFETAVTSWTAGTADYVNTRTFYGSAPYGKYAMRITITGTAAAATYTRCTYYSFTASGAGTYLISGYVFCQGATTPITDIRWSGEGYTGATNTYTQAWSSSTHITNRWYRIYTTLTLAAGDLAGTVELQVKHPSTSTAFQLLLDGVQIENLAYPTTYCDGTQKGCYWTGAPHASTSTRYLSDRTQGREYDLEDTYSAYIMQTPGIGMPPMKMHSQSYAMRQGSEFQFRKVEPRVFNINFRMSGTSIANLHSKRAALIDIIKPDKVRGDQPFLLRYYGADSTAPVEIKCYYDGGMEFSDERGLNEFAAIRCIAYDPFFYATEQSMATLDVNDSVTTVAYAAAKVAADWGDWGGGVGEAASEVNCISYYEDLDTTYIGGNFTTVAGAATTAKYLGQWSGAEWSAVKDMNGIVHCMAHSDTPRLYFAGAFTDIDGGGGGTYNRIAYWPYTGSTIYALTEGGANGADGIIYGMAFDLTGDNLYITGAFANAGGNARAKVAKWTGSAFTALGTGLNGDGYCVAVNPINGYMYFGGAFTTANGVTVNRIAYWNGSTFVPLGSGPGVDDGTVYCMVFDTNGILYVGGSFTTIDAAAIPAVARWTGTAWENMGSGVGNLVSGAVYSMAFDPTGNLWVGGTFSTMGGISTNDGLAMWNGASWCGPDIDFAANTDVNAILFKQSKVNQMFDIYVGTDVAGTATTSGLTTVTNNGTARAYPKFVFRRSGGTLAQVKYIRNEMTGKTLYVNHALRDGETVTIDCAERSVVSSIYGNSIGRVLLRGSDFADFTLLPSTNLITAYIEQAGSPTVDAYVTWYNTYWTADRGGSSAQSATIS